MEISQQSLIEENTKEKKQRSLHNITKAENKFFYYLLMRAKFSIQINFKCDF